MIRRRKPLRKLGRIGRGNEAFRVERLEAWFSGAIIRDPSCIVRRNHDGVPDKVKIEMADGYEGWIERWTAGRLTQHYEFKGINLQVSHVKDKSTDPRLRWSIFNVAPLTPANNKAMKYDHDKREIMQTLMKAWIIKYVGVEGT